VHLFINKLASSYDCFPNNPQWHHFLTCRYWFIYTTTISLWRCFVETMFFLRGAGVAVFQTIMAHDGRVCNFWPGLFQLSI